MTVDEMFPGNNAHSPNSSGSVSCQLCGATVANFPDMLQRHVSYHGHISLLTALVVGD